MSVIQYFPNAHHMHFTWECEPKKRCIQNSEPSLILASLNTEIPSTMSKMPIKEVLKGQRLAAIWWNVEKVVYNFLEKKNKKEPAKIHFTSVSVRSDVFPNALTKPRHSERLHTETHSWWQIGPNKSDIRSRASVTVSYLFEIHYF